MTWVEHPTRLFATVICREHQISISGHLLDMTTPKDLVDRIMKLPRQSANANPRKRITEAEKLT